MRFAVVQSLSHVQLFVNPLRSILGFPVLHHIPELVQTHVYLVSDAIQSSHPCHLLLLLPSIFPSIRVFSNEMTLCNMWPKYWHFSFSISPSNEYPGLISIRIDQFDVLEVQGSLKSLLQHQSLKASVFLVFSLLYGPTLTSIHDYWKNHSCDQMDLCW